MTAMTAMALAVGTIANVLSTAGMAQQYQSRQVVSQTTYLPANSTVIVPSTTWVQPLVIQNTVTQSGGIQSGYSGALPGTNPAKLDWSTAIDSARKALNAATLPNPQAAKNQLLNSIQAAETFLGTAGSQRQSDWLVFLRVDELRAELAKETPDLPALIQIEKHTRQNYPGLDLLPIVQMRRDLLAYCDALRFGAAPEATIAGLDKRLAGLEKQLNDFDPAVSKLELQRDLGLMVNYLYASHQAPALMQQIRNQYSQPTGRAMVSESFLQNRLTRPVNETTPVREMILGTQICGTSTLNGNVTPQLVANNNGATLQLVLSGQFTSRNIGTNRGVTLHTSSSAGIVACESAQLNSNGLSLLNNTYVDTNFRSSIDSIDHNLRIVRKIATKKAAQQKPQADTIAQGRLEDRVKQQYHEQLSQEIGNANSKLSPPSLPAFSRLGLLRPERTSFSSDDFLSLVWRSADKDQLGAQSSCSMPVPNYGVTAQLHQAMLINYLDPVLASRTIRSQDLDDFAIQFGASPEATLKQEAQGEPWAITLAGFHPVEVEFADNLVSFQIRLTKIERGDQALVQPATIRANYAIELSNGTLQLRRQGDVDIQFSGRAQRGLRGVTLRSFLKSKFDEAFRPELFEKPLRLADRLPSGTNLSLVSMATNNGWLQVVLN